MAEERGPETDPSVQKAIDALRTLTDEQRIEAMAEFCTHCGTRDPRCRCWDDS